MESRPASGGGWESKRVAGDGEDVDLRPRSRRSLMSVVCGQNVFSFGKIKTSWTDWSTANGFS